MKHTYKVTGMTCNGCRTSVEKSLNEVHGVLHAEVNLEAETATLEMNSPISIQTFQETLGAKYQITQIDEKHILSNSNISEEKLKEEIKTKSKLQELKPLLLIFLYITSAAVLLNYNNWSTPEAMFDFMGLFYIVFSFFKLLDLKGFPASFRMYDPLAKAIPAYGWIYPFLELGLGLMFLMRFELEVALIATLVVLGITTIGVAQSLLDKKTIRCACLGTALKLPMTEATFIENSIMIAMSLFMLLT